MPRRFDDAPGARGAIPSIDVISSFGEILPVAHTGDLVETVSTLDERQDRAGDVLRGRYRLDSLITESPIGASYSGRDLHTQRSVRVQLLSVRTREAPASFASRFKSDLAPIARLSHANLASLTDYGQTEDGELFIVSEFAIGRPIDHLITESGPLSLDRIINIALGIAAALQHAHANGVFHRQLKAGDVIIETTSDGADRVKVCDTGIAKLFEPDQPADLMNLAEGKTLLGFPSYTAPELIVHGRLDARSDIYSLGAILFHMIAGVPPYTGDSADNVMVQHLNGQLPRIGSVGYARMCTPPLEVTVRRCLSKSRDARFASTAEVITELETILDRFYSATPAPEVVPSEEERPLKPVITPVPAPAAAPVPRPRRGLLVAAMVFVAVGAIGGYQALQQVKEEPPLLPQEVEYQQPPQRIEPAEEKAIVATAEPKPEPKAQPKPQPQRRAAIAPVKAKLARVEPVQQVVEQTPAPETVQERMAPPEEPKEVAREEVVEQKLPEQKPPEKPAPAPLAARSKIVDLSASRFQGEERAAFALMTGKCAKCHELALVLDAVRFGRTPISHKPFDDDGSKDQVVRCMRLPHSDIDKDQARSILQVLKAARAIVRSERE